MKLVGALPGTFQGRAIASQLVRAGTAVGANYRASCRARSHAEFIAKIGIVEEESDECCFWLELIIEASLLKAKLVQPLLQEANELVAIMSASRKSAKNRRAMNGRAKPQSAIANRQSAIP